jgi:hypothetical protein
MTEEQIAFLRQNTNMKLFNFYLDDVTKLIVLQKMRTLGLDGKKGTLAALIRVLLNEFAESDDVHHDSIIKYKVEDEYLLTTKKNKRSKL